MTREISNYSSQAIRNKEYGPLSFRTLCGMMEPAIHERRLHEVLSRLKRRRLIALRTEQSIPGSVFYQISQKPNVRNELREILNCDETSLIQTYFRRRAPLDTEVSARLTFYLRKIFPEARVIRDSEFVENHQLRKYLIDKGCLVEGLKPESLLVTRENTTIAFEVEKRPKSKAELLSHLKKYATGSSIQSLVYLCSLDRIEELLRLFYQTKAILKCLREKQRQNQFLLLACDEIPPGSAEFNVISMDLEVTFLRSIWSRGKSSSPSVCC